MNLERMALVLRVQAPEVLKRKELRSTALSGDAPIDEATYYKHCLSARQTVGLRAVNCYTNH